MTTYNVRAQRQKTLQSSLALSCFENNHIIEEAKLANFSNKLQQVKIKNKKVIDFSKLWIMTATSTRAFALQLNRLSATVKCLCVKTITELFGIFFFGRISFETKLIF